MDENSHPRGPCVWNPSSGNPSFVGFVMNGVPSKYAFPLLIIVHACNAVRAIKVD